MKKVRRFFLLCFWFLLLFSFVLPLYAQEYVLLGLNDLGMHCSNKDFAKVVVLPPFNNVSAQLILKLPNQSPQEVQWTTTLASGLYFYRLEAASVADAGRVYTQVKKMILLK